MASCSGRLFQPQQVSAGLPVGIDRLVATGVDRVSTKASGTDLGSATPCQSFVDDNDRRPVAIVQRRQDADGLTGRPTRSDCRLVIIGVVVMVAASHNAQCVDRRVLTGGKDRPRPGGQPRSGCGAMCPHWALYECGLPAAYVGELLVQFVQSFLYGLFIEPVLERLLVGGLRFLLLLHPAQYFAAGKVVACRFPSPRRG